MRAFVIAIALAMAALAMGEAEARRGLGRSGGSVGPEHVFHTVEPLNIPPDLADAEVFPAEWQSGGELARHVEIDNLVLGYALRDKGYVVRVPGLDSQYWELDAAQMQALSAAGVISSAEPGDQLPLFDYVRGYALWLFGAALLIFQGLVILIRRRRAAEIKAMIGSDYPAFLRLVLINAAQADGDIDNAEVEVIVGVLGKISGAAVSRDEILEQAQGKRMSRDKLVAYLKVCGKHLSAEERQTLVQALALLIGADGLWERREKQTLIAYITALGVDKKAAPAVVEQMARA